MHTCAARGTHHPPASVEPDVADSAGNANENANGNGNTDMIASATGFVGVKVESLRATETGIATGNKLSATGKPNSAQDDAAGPEAGPSVPASSALQKTASAIGTMSANIDAPQSDSPAAKRSPDPAPYISTAQLFARKNPVYFDLKCFGSDMEANSRYCGDKARKRLMDIGAKRTASACGLAVSSVMSKAWGRDVTRRLWRPVVGRRRRRGIVSVSIRGMGMSSSVR
ncbi:hypothetical protein OHC33_009246 [Knufia fluminis]|uniref:Uncharacterized protein n=1 Tax=Knufia fluminis TaxID=191047 RepID=A0AAN8E9C8_9EURO|nr:hypothetical protein OHC33_009246 [Knufia fluminis]